MRRLAVLASLLLLPLAPARAVRGAELDVDLYAELLARHTREVEHLAGTRVAYAAIARDPDWKRLVAGLARPGPGEPAGRAGKLALWIDAYNILAIDLVARNHPVESIRDIGSLFRSVWKLEAGRVGGRAVSLDEIEHGILRPMGDPRIHAAIVCASLSCPALSRQPFRAERIDAQLDAAMRRFLADPRKGLRLDRAEGVLWLSRIFQWFAEDFEPHGGVLAFLSPYLPEDVRAELERRGAGISIRYFEYDWSLNELDSD